LPNASTHIVRFEYNGGVLVGERSGIDSNTHLVFLHGWGANRESLRGVATLFQHTHRVHLLDLPGFGEAPLPPDGWGTIEYADLVQQYLLDQGATHVVLVGHSFGGRVSVRVASRRLAQVHGLVLLGVPGLPQPRAARVRVRRGAIRLLRQTLTALRPVIGTRGLDWHTRRFGSRDYQAAGPLRPVLVRTVTEDLTESARAVACPALLLWGTDDTETPPWLGECYKALLGSRATLILLPHKDHFLYTGTGAHLIGEKMRAWLKDSLA
jgi:pimeloyl-ACP methyl ester carboxylesterase